MTDSSSEEKTHLKCGRLNKTVPLDNPKCLEPTAYCKWRTACPIHLLEKEAKRAGNSESAG